MSGKILYGSVQDLGPRSPDPEGARSKYMVRFGSPDPYRTILKELIQEDGISLTIEELKGLSKNIVECLKKAGYLK